MRVLRLLNRVNEALWNIIHRSLSHYNCLLGVDNVFQSNSKTNEGVKYAYKSVMIVFQHSVLPGIRSLKLLRLVMIFFFLYRIVFIWAKPLCY